jgi:hypothetical protein
MKTLSSDVLAHEAVPKLAGHALAYVAMVREQRVRGPGPTPIEAVALKRIAIQ